MKHLAFAVKAVDTKLPTNHDFSKFLASLLGDDFAKVKTTMVESAPAIDAKGSDELIHHIFVDFNEDMPFSLFKNLRAKAVVGDYQFDGVAYRFDVFALEHDFPNLKDGKRAALVMDMDMTAVQMEGIDEIARRVGVFDEVAEITHSAMHGHLDFKSSLTKRVSLLKGGDAHKIFGDIKNKTLPITDGLPALHKVLSEIKTLSDSKVCIASGGFHEIISMLHEKLPLDAVRANRLSVDSEGKFTGEVDGPIIDAQAKADFVAELKRDGVEKEHIIVIGDGANDLLMMKEAGLAFAYHAKPKVQAEVDNVINVGNLSTVAFIINSAAKAAQTN